MWISQRTLYWLVLASFADSNLLDFSDPGQLTLCINRTLGVSRYIRHRPNSYTRSNVLLVIRMREGYEGRVWGRTDS